MDSFPASLVFRSIRFWLLLICVTLGFSSCTLSPKKARVKSLVMENSRQIVREGLYESHGYCRVHWKVTPLGTGRSDGKGIQVLFENQKDVFIAIGDDAPLAMYDSELRQVVASNQGDVQVGKTMEFIADILPTGIVVYLRSGGHYEKVMSYSKTIPDRFSLFLACQRTGATFEDVWVKEHRNLQLPRH